MLLESLRQDVIACALEAERQGLCKKGSGNVSAFDPETNLILITPSGTDRSLLQPADICVLDGDMRCLEGQKPSSETLMHLACYRARPDIRAIVHTHSRFASAFAVWEKPVPAIVYEMFSLHPDQGRIPVAPYARPGTQALAEHVADTLRRSDVALMARHGAIAAGDSLSDALRKAGYIEELAEIYLYTLCIGQGKEPPCFTQEELDAWQYPDALS